MSSWTDIKVADIKPKPKKEEGIDWLKECEKIKKACEIKTKVPMVLYYHRKPIISNKTEISKVI